MKKEIKFFKKISKFFENLIISAAYRPALAFLFLLGISLAIGGFLFYRYVFLGENNYSAEFENSLLLKENVQKDVLSVWEENERRFLASDAKEYQDLFRIEITSEKENPEELTE